MMRKCVALVAFVALAFGAVGCAGASFADLTSGLPESPPREHMEAMAVLLPPPQPKELLVFWDEHNDLLDARVHTKDTCPFIAWIPNKAKHDAGEMSDEKWAKWMHRFYRHKHEEEGDCHCDERLGVAKPAPATPGVTGTFTIEPDVAPPAPDAPGDDKDDKDDDRDKLVEDLVRKYLQKHADKLGK